MLGINSSTSRWVDVVEMIQAQEIEVLNAAKENKTEEFLKNLAEYKKTTGKTSSGKINVYLQNMSMNVEITTK